MRSIGISWRKNIIKLQIIQFYCSKTPLQSLKSKDYSLSSHSLPDLRRQKAILHRGGWFKTLWPLYSASVAHFGISGETRRLMLIPKSGRRARDKNRRESSSSEDSQYWTLGFLAKMMKSLKSATMAGGPNGDKIIKLRGFSELDAWFLGEDDETVRIRWTESNGKRKAIICVTLDKPTALVFFISLT